MPFLRSVGQAVMLVSLMSALAEPMVAMVVTGAMPTEPMGAMVVMGAMLKLWALLLPRVVTVATVVTVVRLELLV
jgi:hypothetical protein